MELYQWQNIYLGRRIQHLQLQKHNWIKLRIVLHATQHFLALEHIKRMAGIAHCLFFQRTLKVTEILKWNLGSSSDWKWNRTASFLDINLGLIVASVSNPNSCSFLEQPKDRLLYGQQKVILKFENLIL